jgi:hypothetical protein
LLFLDPPHVASFDSVKENFKSEIIFWHENYWLFTESLYHCKLKRFKSEIIICYEDNWLFNILFRDDLDGETI